MMQLIRKWWIAFAMVIVVATLAGCGDEKCDAICQAKQQRELQQVQLDMAADAQLQPMIANAVSVLLISNIVTLLLIAGEAVIFGWRKLVFPVATLHETQTMYLDANVAISVAQAQQQLAPVTNNYGSAIDAEWREVEQPLQLATAQPVAPSWQQLQQQGFVATPERFIVAYAASGPLTIDLNGNSSIAVIGRSGQGKTTAVRWYVKQATMFGGVVVFDPHGAIIPHGGMARVAFANSNNRGQMDDLAGKLQEELIRRLDAYAQGERNYTPITVMADELPTLSQQSGDAINILGRVILEGRKVKLFIVLAGQGIPASILEAASGGRRVAGSLYRDSFTVRVGFSASTRMAGMVGFNAEECQLIDELGDAPGKCYVEGPMRMTFAAMPNISSSDLVGTPQLARPYQPLHDAPTQALDEPKQDTIEEQAAALYANGASVREVARALDITEYRAYTFKQRQTAS